ncbi:MAG: hypothetical protein IKS68_04470 [Mailhella sp.]|nr:hypothetical protein [Mailhella sp.]MBR4746632.1 hypothetical protein [Desulfovibrio sp.]MBR6467875.1 hypothetical protein [Desulfovibrio sp.]
MSYVNLKAPVAGLVAVCGLCLLLKVYHDEETSHMDDHAVRVRSMDVVLELHRDNRVTVTERLQAEILDSRCSGLHRTLNLSPRTPVRMAEALRRSAV